MPLPTSGVSKSHHRPAINRRRSGRLDVTAMANAAAQAPGGRPLNLQHPHVTLQGTAQESSNPKSAFNDDAAEKRRRRSSIRSANEKNRRRSVQPFNRSTPDGESPRATGFSLSADSAFDSSNGSRVPIMANFEEWMKLVKENKINASNSWNFALIDYFHDMSVLKEGDGINFQKASFTLDGCVKIYTSRVDSVASETGKLLSGLADKDLSQRRGRGAASAEDGEEDEEGDREDGEEDENGRSKRAKRKHRSEHTLVKSFSQIQVKKLELELAVDPLFKKMCSDFNEGGAHSLLLNNLGMDSTGRVVFDGQAENAKELEKTPAQTQTDQPENNPLLSHQVDLIHIRDRYFSNLLDEDITTNSLLGSPQGSEHASLSTPIDKLSVCSSLPMLEEIVKNPSASNNIIRDIEAMRMEAQDIFSQPQSTQASKLLETSSTDIGLGWDDSVEMGNGSALQYKGPVDDYGSGDYDVGPVGQDYDDDEGPGGAIVEPQQDLDLDLDLDLEFGVPTVPVPSVNIESEIPKDSIPSEPANDKASLQLGFANSVDIMAYFDESLKASWAGPEHWKVQRVKAMIGINKKATQPTNAVTVNDGDLLETEEGADGVIGTEPATTTTARKRKAFKEPLMIDFKSDDADVDPSDIFTAGTYIDLPKTQRKTKHKNLLPVDEHFSSKELISIFLKPEAKLFRSEKLNPQSSSSVINDSNPDAISEHGLARPDLAVDENFFAQNMNEDGRTNIQPDFGDAAFPNIGNTGDDDDDDGGDFDYGVQIPDVDDDELAGPGMPLDGLAADPFQSQSGLNGSQAPFPSQFGANGLPFGASSRHRPEYVSYAKSAKKVDVKLLKNNIWKVLDISEASEAQEEAEQPEEQDNVDKDNNKDNSSDPETPDNPVRQFSDIMNGLGSMYRFDQLQDISTSFCFISLLHLANEKGLVLTSNDDNTDIAITRDLTVTKEQLSA